MAREGGTYLPVLFFFPATRRGTIGNGNIQIRTPPTCGMTYTGTVFADKPSWITAALGSIPNL